jgi:GTPase SAR1 family protein
MNKTRWKLMQEIVHSIQEVNGYVFGGYVRDKIIHDHYATLFYSNIHNTRSEYKDPYYKPESALRLLIPSDIDCFMHTSQIKLFKKKLEENLLSVEEIISDLPCSIYFPDAPQEILHTKWKISFNVHPLLSKLIGKMTFSIPVDILHSAIPNLKPPFGTIDFECNALLLTPDDEYKLADEISIYLPPKEKIEKLNRIISEIILQTTSVIYKKLPKYRIYHMVKKGWTIKTNKFELVKTIELEEVCCICLSSFDKPYSHLKFKCCNARMCFKSCSRDWFYHRYINCPLCRKNTPIMDDDIKLLS